MYFSLREGINPLKGFLGSRHTCKDSITRQNFNRSSKEQTNMVLPSLDRLSYITPLFAITMQLVRVLTTLNLSIGATRETIAVNAAKKAESKA